MGRWAVGLVVVLVVAGALWMSGETESVDDDGLTAADRKHIRERRTNVPSTTQRRPARRAAATPIPVATPFELTPEAADEQGLDWEEEVEATVIAHLERGAEPGRAAIQDLFAVGAISEDALAKVTPMVDDLDEELADIDRRLASGELETMEAARLATEAQSDAYSEVMGVMPPQVGLKLLKFFAGPTALPDLED